ncbi:MAG: hypothetical protein AAF959_00575 [Cyanobacteria bacterium P01_D01_bin.56]
MTSQNFLNNGHKRKGNEAVSFIVERDSQIENSLDDSEFFTQVAQDPIIAEHLKHLNDKTQQPSWIRKYLWLDGNDLHGPVADRLTRRRAELMAATGLTAQSINCLTGWPFATAAMGGWLFGTALTLSVYSISTVLLKKAVIKPHQKNKWADTALITYTIISLAASIPSPLGIGLMRFQEDLRNQLAEEVVDKYALAEEIVEIDSAKDQLLYAKKVEQKCTNLMREYENRKNKGDSSYHHYFRQAKGPYIHNESSGRWDGIPTESLPICPKAERLQDEGQRLLAMAQSDHRDAFAAVKQTFGENYAAYLKEEKPELYAAYFYPHSGRIRSSRQEITELLELLYNGESGVKAIMLVPAILSTLTSVASVLLTLFYADLMSVKAGWKARTAFVHNQKLLANLNQFKKRDSKND